VPLRRRYSLEPPTFRQTIAIIRNLLQERPSQDPASCLEAIKRRHLALGFTYDNPQIHRALAALAFRPGKNRINSRSGPTRARTTRR